MTSVNIRVVVRFRPRNAAEIRQGKNVNAIEIHDNQVIVRSQHRHCNPFSYDYVFPPETTQKKLFQHVGVGIIDNVLNGFNSTLFAYGQTGSGKTFTLVGDYQGVDNPENQGVIPRACDYLFESIENNEEIEEALIKISCVEIYNERIQDLLSENPKEKLRLREKPDKTIYIQGAVEVCVACQQDIYDCLHQAFERRTTASTEMNDQ